MMNTFLITFILFLLVILGMAIGYIFSRREIKGSCGGISALGMKKVCDCDEPCDKRKAQIAKEQNQHKYRTK